MNITATLFTKIILFKCVMLFSKQPLTSFRVAGCHVEVINEEEVGLLALCGGGHLPRAGEGVGGPVLQLHDLTKHRVQEQLTGHCRGHHHLRVGLLGEDHGLWREV